ncbi:hypothetical protein Droror1_Dr00024635 [Drosera rotundifolia]
MRHQVRVSLLVKFGLGIVLDVEGEDGVDVLGLCWKFGLKGSKVWPKSAFGLLSICRGVGAMKFQDLFFLDEFEVLPSCVARARPEFV